MPRPRKDLTYTRRLSSAIDEAFERYQQGAPHAEEELYGTFRAQAHNVTVHRLDWGQAADVERDIVHRAMMAVKGFRGESRPSTWFYRLAVNEASRALRRLIDDRRRLASLTETDDSGEETELPNPAKPANDDARIDLEKLLRWLPREQAELISLKQDGYSLEEIAQKTGEPLGTIRSRHRLAKEKLKPHLKHLKLSRR